MAEQVYTYALTTLQRVKDRMKITSTDGDSVLQRLINSATDYIESNCGRRFMRSTYMNELHSLRGNGEEYLTLRQWPVTALSAFEYRAGSPSNPSWTAFLPDQFELVEDGASGLVRVYGALGPFFYSGTNAIRATYTAGYLFDWSNFGSATHTLPADLTDLCERMVVRWWKKREHEGKRSEGIKDSSVTWSDLIEPQDADVIARYSRLPEFV